MIFILLIIKLSTISKCVGINVDLAPLEQYLSIDTFEAFNMSKEYKKFDMSEFDALANNTRRWDHMPWWLKHYRSQHHYSESYLIHRSCYLNTQTYLSALEEIRKYYQIRFLYVNNEQYEVGYLVHEIVSKYQMMLEIYQLIVRRFYYAQEKNFAPATYMLYMYTNVLEYSMTVVHLCNMLHEIPKKYKKIVKKSVFDDDDDHRSTTTRSKMVRNTTKEKKWNIDRDKYLSKLAAEKKRRKKELERLRKEAILSGNWKPSAVDNRPKKSSWPLHYGWSIEFW